MTRKFTLEMYVLIYSSVAFTAMANNKIRRSILSPGQAIITTTSKAASKTPSLPYIEYWQKRKFELRKYKIKQYTRSMLLYL